MLSKSQARAFFVGGTFLFSAIFLWLTVDTLRQIPKQSKVENMTEAVVRGKHLFDKNNCMGCHTILGEGAYYAPELTKVYERRGPDWMKLFLKDPQAMYPGERKMTQYHLQDQEIDDLVAFFKWIGEIDLNGFPAKPDLAPAAAAAPAAASGQTSQTAAAVSKPAMLSSVCMGCHTVEGQGGKVGPSLDGVGSRMTEAEIAAFIGDPQKIRPGTAMPNLGLSDPVKNELASYLAGMR
ncbi:Nitric oxide reductase subunit C [compost metagenome]